jgi:hypothetical protein
MSLPIFMDSNAEIEIRGAAAPTLFALKAQTSRHPHPFTNLPFILHPHPPLLHPLEEAFIERRAFLGRW